MALVRVQRPSVPRTDREDVSPTKSCDKGSSLPPRSPVTMANDSADCEGSPTEDLVKSPSTGSTTFLRDPNQSGECYVAVKGAAVVLPQNECVHIHKPKSTNGGDIQLHLQSMLNLLRPEDTLKMAVKLESVFLGRVRYLSVISSMGRTGPEECLLGIDCNPDKSTTFGLVLAVWVDTHITLDGDGGFSVSTNNRHHVFKPVSVQAMWSALQTLHRGSGNARACNYFIDGGTHEWTRYYEERIASDRSCLNEWHAMENVDSRRSLSPVDASRSEPTERESTRQIIRSKLRDIMLTLDLDDVTSKYIRSRLEDDMNMVLSEYKSFIDEEMLCILGQMDAATEIFDYLYLGSEWNASNMEELQKNNIGYIVNVTREIDNFFPGMFNYLNVRVHDDERTELLRHWDRTYKFITQAKNKGSKVLVHCKMGISRSASVVIAYAMKQYSWNLQMALQYVKAKRTCVKPNQAFLKQLETYQGILDASKQRHKFLWRSKSETNLKRCHGNNALGAGTLVLSPTCKDGPDDQSNPKRHHALAGDAIDGELRAERQSRGSSMASSLMESFGSIDYLDMPSPSGRPKSWSPDDCVSNALFADKGETANSRLNSTNVDYDKDANQSACSCSSHTPCSTHILSLCSNGQAYSVSPNKALHLTLPISPVFFNLDSPDDDEGEGEQNSPVYECTSPIYRAEPVMALSPMPRTSSIKDRINELESQIYGGGGAAVMNLASQYQGEVKGILQIPVLKAPEVVGLPLVCVRTQRGDSNAEGSSAPGCQFVSKFAKGPRDPFSSQLDSVFDGEERGRCPTRQSSWGSCDSAVSRDRSGSSECTPVVGLSRDTSFRSGTRKSSADSFFSPTEAINFEIANSPGYSQSAVTDSILKRTGSFSDSLAVQLSFNVPSSLKQESKLNPIQRSQSLRVQKMGCSRRGEGVNSMQLHAPVPYRSPTLDHHRIPADSAVTGAQSADRAFHHCRSMPILTEGVQLNPRVTYVETKMKAVKASQKPSIIDDIFRTMKGAIRSKAEARTLPSPGIVRSQKKALETKFAQSSPKSPKADFVSYLDTKIPDVDSGVVSRITREIESKQVGKSDDVISPSVEARGIPASTEEEIEKVLSEFVVNLSNDESSVKHLVDKFEIKELMDQQVGSPTRHRFFSEGDAAVSARKKTGGSQLRKSLDGPPTPPRRFSRPLSVPGSKTEPPPNYAKPPVGQRKDSSDSGAFFAGLRSKPKKHQGKTHPLSKLSSVQPRHSSPVVFTTT